MPSVQRGWGITHFHSLRGVVILTLLYTNSEAVIPAPYQVRGKLQRESSPETLDFGSSLE